MIFSTKTSIKPSQSSVLSYRSKPRLNISAFPVAMSSDINTDLDDHDMARFIMALRAQGIRDTRLMAAFEHTPRAAFFEPNYAAYLYQDVALPLSCGEEASSPHFIARVLAVSCILPNEQVLEIGTGSGYQTALLSLISKRVVSIDRYRTLATLARKSLSAVGMSHIDLRVGDGLAGYDLPQASFDCIIINGALSDVPEALSDRLLPNGRLVLCMQNQGEQILQVIHFKEDRVEVVSHGAVNSAPMKLGRAVAL